MVKTSIPRLIGRMIVRLYTFAILAVVLWSGYTAVTYLYRSVFQTARTPQTIREWQGAIRSEALRQPAAAGITEPAARSPIGHYHGVDRWFEPDPHNGCIASGCHDPIPHSRNKAVRAFANLHSTFMSCETCHRAPVSMPMPAVWVTTKTGDKQDVPSILKLMGLLSTTTQPADGLAGFSASTVSLLQEAIVTAGKDPVLEYLAQQIETSEAGSPVWRRAMDQLRSELPNHARGEYGAKIVPAVSSSDLRPIPRDEQAAGQSVPQLHKDVISSPEGCLACHRAQPSLLDFAALGYPADRVRTLTHTPIAEMMQQIRKGQPFNLPLAP